VFSKIVSNLEIKNGVLEKMLNSSFNTFCESTMVNDVN